MKRRDFFSKTGSVIAAASIVESSLASVAFAEEKKGAHAHAPSPHTALAVSAEKCVGVGEACLDHCIDMLSSGDTSMAACAKSVREMLMLCRALSQAARQGSKRVPALAKMAGDACKECIDECRKHSTHAICKACADACEDCAKHCKAAAA